METAETNENVGSITSGIQDEHDATAATQNASLSSGGEPASNNREIQVDSHHRLPENDIYEENCINLSLLDPARYGWMALGGIADVSTPYEVRCCRDEFARIHHEFVA